MSNVEAAVHEIYPLVLEYSMHKNNAAELQGQEKKQISSFGKRKHKRMLRADRRKLKADKPVSPEFESETEDSFDSDESVD